MCVTLSSEKRPSHSMVLMTLASASTLRLTSGAGRSIAATRSMFGREHRGDGV